jgi:hypothetical protein
MFIAPVSCAATERFTRFLASLCFQKPSIPKNKFVQIELSEFRTLHKFDHSVLGAPIFEDCDRAEFSSNDHRRD